MFGKIGIGQILVVFGIFVLFFGYKKLPELGRGLGNALKEFKSSIAEKDDPIDVAASSPDEKRK